MVLRVMEAAGIVPREALLLASVSAAAAIAAAT